MEDYQDLYDEARRQYNDAVYEIGQCERRISELEQTKRNCTNEINRLSSKIKEQKAAIKDLDGVLKMKSGLEDKLSAIDKKIATASETYSSMVKSSNAANRSVDDAFGNNASRSGESLESIMEAIKGKRAQVDNDLAESERAKKKAQARLDDAKACLRDAKNDLAYWKQKKKNASSNMAYYKKKLDMG